MSWRVEVYRLSDRSGIHENMTEAKVRDGYMDASCYVLVVGIACADSGVLNSHQFLLALR